MQKYQTLFLTAAYALLQTSKPTIGETGTPRIHALVLILSGHREFNLKRRELLKPDLSEFELKTNRSVTPVEFRLLLEPVNLLKQVKRKIA